jgi:outer membrane protein
MKKSSLIINVVLFVAVAVLYVLHFATPNSKNNLSNSVNSDTSAQAAQGGIVYINIDSVLSKYVMYADINANLQTKLKTKEAELQSKQRAFEKKVNDYQNKVSKGLVTRTEAAGIEQNLQVEQQGLMKLQQQMQYELADEEQVAQRKVLNSIMEYLKSIENEQAYQFVLGTTFGGNVLYANDNLNITLSVIEGLNKKYAESKK